MLGSKSYFFFNPDSVLLAKRKQLENYLDSMEYPAEKKGVYLKAYDYFCMHPLDFDGATLVKDLNHIPGLDINAMLHDYQYLVYNVSSHFLYKWKADWLYAKEMELTGRGILSWIRWFGLKIIGPLFVFYSFWKHGRIKISQEFDFQIDYEIIMKK